MRKEDHEFKAGLRYTQRLCLKKKKRGYLTSKALNSIPSSEKKKNIKKK
jgi:hypothetical protein